GKGVEWGKLLPLRRIVAGGEVRINRVQRVREMKALVVVAALVTALAGVASAMDASQYSRTMDQVGEMHEAGRLAEADAFVSKILEEQGASLTPEQKRALEYELERSRRIREDYSTTESELIEI